MADSTGKNIDCCVCNKPILDNNSCFSMGSEGYRHKKCCVGSKAWKTKYGLSEIGKMMESKSYKPDAGPLTKSAEKNDPIRKAVKEFIGRIKYNSYMDTTNSAHFNWSVQGVINGHMVSYVSGDDKPTAEGLYETVRK